MEETIIICEECPAEVIDVIADNGSGKCVFVAAGVGVALIGGFILYKKVIKPLIAKRKASKESKAKDQTEEQA